LLRGCPGPSLCPYTSPFRSATADDLLAPEVRLDQRAWAHRPVAGEVLAQCSAHGEVAPAVLDGEVLRWREPRRKVAPGQSVVLYDGDTVVGSALAAG